MALETYSDVEQLREGRWTTIYRAVRSIDQRPILLEVLDPDHCGAEAPLLLSNQLDIGRALEGVAVLAPLALSTFNGRPALELEDSGGAPLESLLGEPMPIGAFLELALRLTAVLADLHKRGVVHGDLHPRHILVDSDTGQVQLCGLSHARRVTRDRVAARPVRRIEGSLPYISPEQAGSLNRTIDHRSDLYALGVIFFQLLTGRLPFEARDASGWVHCHIARRPSSPRDLGACLPAVVSNMVHKLLAKTPEERYQSGTGLAHDLRRCRAAWRDTGQITPFPLGLADVSDRFTIPHKRYGRERERAALLDWFDKVARGGAPALVLVAGAPGIGKSSLVHELERPSAARGGRFSAGKFDQHNREVPYAAVVDAFRELALDILAESAEQVAAWRARIGTALGSNAALVCDLIPQVELIVGPQPPVPELPPAEAEQRLRRVLSRFVAAFPSAEQPLTIFLDDLQWGDAASIRLLVDLVADGELRHLLIVGAYRDGELELQHPLRRARAQLRGLGAVVHELTLGPLSAGDIDQLVADVVHTSRAHAAPLARAIGDKTHGNPFFVVQLLSELYRLELISFDAEAGRWRWELAGIRAQRCADNVIELIAGKLRNLPRALQETLRVAACLGGTFDADTLALVLERDPGPALATAVAEELLLQVDRSYRFPHDRVQEAAYSLIAAGERPALHRKLGQKLLAGTPKDALETRIYEVVAQLHRGSALLTSQAEREQLAALDLCAGRRAQGSAAYVSARSYFAAGSALLADDSWQREYELAFALELRLAECELATSELAGGEARLGRLSQRARGLVDRAAVVCLQGSLAVVRNQFERGTETIFSYLRCIGGDWPLHPTQAEVREEYERFRRRLGDRPIESLLELPATADPTVQATLKVLEVLILLAAFSDDKLSNFVVCRMANLCLEHGHNDASALAFVFLGRMIGPHFGDYHASYRFARLALDLQERRGQSRFRERVLNMAGAFVHPWTQPLRGGVELLRRGFDAALENGEPVHVWGAATAELAFRLIAGDPLEQVEQAVERLDAFSHKAQLAAFFRATPTGVARLIRSLRGLTPAFPSFDDASFDEREFEALLASDPALVYPEAWYWIRKLQARCLGGDYAGALAAGARAETLLWTTPYSLERVEFHLYRALALAAHFGDAAASDQPQLRAALGEHVRALAARAEDCPANFACQAALVAAELARIDGDHERAGRGYEQARKAARAQGFVSLVAISCETAARFFRARGFALMADTYLCEARDYYRRWGAEGKVRQLERQYPALVVRAAGAGEALGLRAEQLDLLAVVKASQTISGVMVHEQVLETLLQLVLEQGGARRARLILVREARADPSCDAGEERELPIAAEAAVSDLEALDPHAQSARSNPGRPDDQAPATPRAIEGLAVSTAAAPRAQPGPRVPASIVRYVERTESPVLLDDAAADAGRFAGDPYFACVRPRSVLCLPVRHHGVLVGILYLENDLAPGVFTPDRLLALELLATQAAVSLENAHLLARERAGREQAERDRQRASLLGEATALLSSAPDGMAQALRHVCAHGLADWATLEVMAGGTVARVACTHRDLAKEPLLYQASERCPGWFRAGIPASRALPERAHLLLPSISDAQLRAYCVDAQHAELARELGLESVLVVPLIARGARLGALCLASATSHRFQPGDVELAVELGRRVATALDNAQLAVLENQLRQAQKMEAIGRLAGGIAHDFNNLLCVILSYTHLLNARLRPWDTSRKELDEVRQAAERAGELTRQLLAFSRQKVLEPRAVDVNQVVSGVAKMLMRLLGAEIRLSYLLAPSLWNTWADPAQLEQVLINLAVNARDAMPSGGTLTLTTSNVELDQAHARDHAGATSGPHVKLAVTDTGCGMAREVRARIFEPFFTTKEPGRGTGLGLATVFAIVQQSGGHISVESERDRGTTFNVYLPRCAPAVELESATPSTSLSSAGMETILLVEDDERVRVAVRSVLEHHGYSVLEAAGPGEALLICEQHRAPIDLLLSDVAMPRMTGPELAQRIGAMRPEIRRLLMSGYSDGSSALHALAERGHAFLQKPLTPQALTHKIRELLDAQAADPNEAERASSPQSKATGTSGGA